jgi:hypothetical protein
MGHVVLALEHHHNINWVKTDDCLLVIFLVGASLPIYVRPIYGVDRAILSIKHVYDLYTSNMAKSRKSQNW